MIESRCGIVCSKCSWLKEKKCSGCIRIKDPFWGSCPVKKCCEGKGQEHCGTCDQFPCAQLHAFAYDKEQGDGGARLDQCRIWAASAFMKYSWMDEYLQDKAGVTKDIQQEWGWIRYMVGCKMFAALCLGEDDKPYYITLKLEPMEGDFLRQQYEDIIPGYYMNKIHWNSIKPNGEVPDELLKDLLDKSYRLVLAGFSKKRQREILEEAEKPEGAE